MTDVLVVDDDYDIRETIRDVLSDVGLDVECVADGDSALAWLRTHAAPKVVLLDWMMPRCDGAAFRARQLADEQLARIPVVILTADTQIGTRPEARGVAALLQKPVSLTTLVATIERFR